VKETDATPHPNLVPLSSVTVSKPEIIVATVLSIMAAFSLLSAAVLIYRKCSSASVRVHAANELHSGYSFLSHNASEGSDGRTINIGD